MMHKLHLVTRVRKRLAMIIVIFIMVSSGVAISLYYASDNIVFFLKPSELSVKHMGKKIRIGGLVVKGSIKKMPDRSTAFNITDNNKTIAVTYRGIIPALFRDEQGVVVEGILISLDGVFVADAMLTKHDENYRPPK